jgi:hypothetical protein
MLRLCEFFVRFTHVLRRFLILLIIPVGFLTMLRKHSWQSAKDCWQSANDRSFSAAPDHVSILSRKKGRHREYVVGHPDKAAKPYVYVFRNSCSLKTLCSRFLSLATNWTMSKESLQQVGDLRIIRNRCLRLWYF